MINFRTLWAKVQNFFSSELTHVNLGRLKAAAEADYDLVLRNAENALHVSVTEVEKVASAEVKILERSMASLAARAEGLLHLGVLPAEHADRAAVVANTGTQKTV